MATSPVWACQAGRDMLLSHFTLPFESGWFCRLPTPAPEQCYDPSPARVPAHGSPPYPPTPQPASRPTSCILLCGADCASPSSRGQALEGRPAWLPQRYRCLGRTGLLARRGARSSRHPVWRRRTTAAWTLLSALTRNGQPAHAADSRDGGALNIARRRKAARYLELGRGGPQRLCILTRPAQAVPRAARLARSSCAGLGAPLVEHFDCRGPACCLQRRVGHVERAGDVLQQPPPVSRARSIFPGIKVLHASRCVRPALLEHVQGISPRRPRRRRRDALRGGQT